MQIDAVEVSLEPKSKGSSNFCSTQKPLFGYRYDVNERFAVRKQLLYELDKVSSCSDAFIAAGTTFRLGRTGPGASDLLLRPCKILKEFKQGFIETYREFELSLTTVRYDVLVRFTVETVGSVGDVSAWLTFERFLLPRFCFEEEPLAEKMMRLLQEESKKARCKKQDMEKE